MACACIRLENTVGNNTPVQGIISCSPSTSLDCCSHRILKKEPRFQDIPLSHNACIEYNPHAECHVAAVMHRTNGPQLARTLVLAMASCTIPFLTNDVTEQELEAQSTLFAFYW